nr:unnamed protein product [Callosobruchus chinensis]
MRYCEMPASHISSLYLFYQNDTSLSQVTVAKHLKILSAYNDR